MSALDLISNRTLVESMRPRSATSSQEEGTIASLANRISLDIELSIRMEDRKLLLLSDTHMGKGLTNNFGNKSKSFLDFMRALSSLDEKPMILLLGDAFETWQGDHRDSLQNLQAAVRENAKILDSIVEYKNRGGDYLYIPGNHDAVVTGNTLPDHPFFQQEGCIKQGPVMVELAGQRTVFMHGHEVDTFNDKEHAETGKSFSRFAGRIERYVGGPFIENVSVESTMSRIGDFFLSVWYYIKSFGVALIRVPIDGLGNTAGKIHTLAIELFFGRIGAHLKENLNEMSRFEAALRRTNNCAIRLFTGHTHYMGYLDNEYLEKWYCNTGTWAGANTRQFIAYDPKNEHQIEFFQLGENGRKYALENMRIEVLSKIGKLFRRST